MVGAWRKIKQGRGVRSIVLNRVVRENSMRRKLLSKDLDTSVPFVPTGSFSFFPAHNRLEAEIRNVNPVSWLLGSDKQ